VSGVRIKLCGLTRAEDAVLAVELGAWALGLVFYAKSPRAVTPQRAREVIASAGSSALKVGVFVDATLQEIVSTVEIAHLTGVQLHGEETPAFCAELKARLKAVQVFKAFRPQEKGSRSPVGERNIDPSTWASVTDALLIDAWSATEAGGTGLRADWATAAALAKEAPLILAGGLDASNISEALQQVRPFAVDVSSRLERAPGEKDADKVRRFFAAATGGPA
jgi:phosphoribosylanthranilate isomerase